MSSYCTDSYDDLDVLQGDIFKKINPEGEDELFIIISADCDIANNKLGKSGLTCLSILSLDNYFFNEHCAIKHQKQIETKLNSLIELVNDHWISLSTTHKKIDGKNIINWIKEEDIDTILSALKVDKKDTITKIKTLYDIIKRYTTHKDTKECKDIELLTIINGKNHSAPMDSKAIIRKYMGELSKSPSQDLFFIPSIPTLDDIGYVVKLRSLFFMSTEHCFTSSSKAKSSPLSYIRIGRLTPTFKHALAQQFGILFSRIGFPAYYEHDVKDSFSIFLEKY